VNAEGRYNHPAMVEPSGLAPGCSAAPSIPQQAWLQPADCRPDRRRRPAQRCSWLGCRLVLKILVAKAGSTAWPGRQARLIDDITGTTPPTTDDRAGPAQPEQTCRELAAALGVPVAVV